MSSAPKLRREARPARACARCDAAARRGRVDALRERSWPALASPAAGAPARRRNHGVRCRGGLVAVREVAQARQRVAGVLVVADRERVEAAPGAGRRAGRAGRRRSRAARPVAVALAQQARHRVAAAVGELRESRRRSRGSVARSAASAAGSSCGASHTPTPPARGERRRARACHSASGTSTGTPRGRSAQRPAPRAATTYASARERAVLNELGHRRAP